MVNSKQGGHVLIFGAGSIGRGLMGQLAAHSGMRPVFVEPDEPLRRRLVAADQYRVHLTGREPATFTVADFTVIGPDDTHALAECVRTCELAVTAVGGPHLKPVAGVLAAALDRRDSPLPVLLCENWPEADVEMARHLCTHGAEQEAFFCVPASVERMVRPTATLDLVGESCETLYADGAKWPEPRPALAGLHFVDGLTPYYKRKLFANNGGHALLAYRGALLGCRTLCESLEDPAVARDLHAFLGVGAEALHLEYGMERSALDGHLKNLVRHRFPNRDLADTVRRVGREPLRKLGPDERLMGLLRLAQSHGLDVGPVCKTIGAVMHYFDPDDGECARMRQMLAENGPESVLRGVCGLCPHEPAFARVLESYAVFGKQDRKEET